MTEPDVTHEVRFDASYARTAGLHSVEIDGETVVYVAPTESLHLLDATATVVWQALDGDVTLGTLCDELAVAFGVSTTQIRNDVELLVQSLTTLGIVSVAD